VEIREEAPSGLADYARVPIAFDVRERLAVRAVDAGLGGLLLVPEPVRAPYRKDYDAEPGQHPTGWPAQFDLSRWGLVSAWVDGARAGGAVVAWDTPGRRDARARPAGACGALGPARRARPAAARGGGAVVRGRRGVAGRAAQGG
jgi:hypothetical protein